MTLSTTIEHWPIGRLIPYARNARTHSAGQVAQVAASMREFGFTNPILVDTQSGVLAGHARLAAAHMLGLTEVPVIVLDHLTQTQQRAYVIVDNKLALNAGWDDELLAVELAGLADGQFDLKLLGFDQEELDRLRDTLDAPLADEGRCGSGGERGRCVATGRSLDPGRASRPVWGLAIARELRSGARWPACGSGVHGSSLQRGLCA